MTQILTIGEGDGLPGNATTLQGMPPAIAIQKEILEGLSKIIN
jgi:hypothetical protein